MKKILLFILSFSVITAFTLYDSNASLVIDDMVVGSLTYDQSTSTDYMVGFSLPTQDFSIYSISEILNDVSKAYNGKSYAMYVVRRPENITYEYELLNSGFSVIEIMPAFDTILFFASTDEMAILLNGNVIKYYNNTVGIEYINLRYTGFPNEEYQDGYIAGLNDGKIDGQTTGYIEGYADARRELWTSRYEVGYNEARGDYGYYNSDTGEWEPAGTRYQAGYDNGIKANNSDAFDAGFAKGSTDSFSAKLSDWIVPAIVIVLFLGGVIVIFNRRMGGNND